MMDKLEVCKAEIFRRSESRIIKREKERRKIFGTATLMLLLVLAALPFLLMLMDAYSNTEEGMYIKLSEDKGEEIYTLYSQSHITDGEKLSELCEFIDKHTDFDQNKYYGQVGAQTDCDSNNNKNDYQDEYEVMFTYYINGRAHCYVINESFLINTKTYQITELSEDEKKELLSLLGIQKEE